MSLTEFELKAELKRLLEENRALEQRILVLNQVLAETRNELTEARRQNARIVTVSDSAEIQLG